jgi:hypothetical protein
MRDYTPINVRFPPPIYDAVTKAAAAERRSLNMQVLTLVEEALKEREAKIAQPQRS